LRVSSTTGDGHVSLKDEIKKKHPFEHPAEEAYLNLLRTAAVLSARFEDVFKPTGLSEPQYNVLRILRGVGGCGLPSTEIGARMIARVPDVTRLVDRLEAAGLVERCRIAEDRRVVQVKVTKKGLKILGNLDEPLTHVNRELFRHMSRAELGEMSRLLEKARHAPEQQEQQPA
jgi:DNA-binding MarR family transcriptional regulator